MTKVIVVGSGGREHTIAWKLSKIMASKLHAPKQRPQPTQLS